ncbi:MAG: shikimate dehydrogenase [Bacteroidetes bacterium]|nr:shikimate dehydrogenase [Bacteroidota bacterium]
MKKHFGLIGSPLSHTYSEKYFTEKFAQLQIDAEYALYDLPHLENIRELVNFYQLNGFNVTIPHKQKIISFLHEMDEDAKMVGAVNCVTVINEIWKGYNTDIIGFKKSLLHFIPDTSCKALIFGTGGASKAVTYVLSKLKIPFQLVSRNEIQGGITYADLNQQIFDEYELLINTTPVGMYPDLDDFLPIPFHLCSSNHYAFDLIYNPKETIFLKAFEARGCKIKNGLEMLHLQADAAYEIFMQDV